MPYLLMRLPVSIRATLGQGALVSSLVGRSDIYQEFWITHLMRVSRKILCSWTADLGTAQTKKNLKFMRYCYKDVKWSASNIPNKSAHRNYGDRRHTDVGTEIDVILLRDGATPPAQHNLCDECLANISSARTTEILTRKGNAEHK